MITFSETGWHGVISDEIGFETISIVAQAVADCLNDEFPSDPVVLAYDTRFLSREYAWSIQRVLTANRIKVFMHKKPVPTSFLSMSVSSCMLLWGYEQKPSRKIFRVDIPVSLRLSGIRGMDGQVVSLSIQKISKKFGRQQAFTPIYRLLLRVCG